jgi:hypothetical protein
MRRRLFATFLFLACAGLPATQCSHLTEIFVVVDSDLGSDRIDRIAIDVQGPSGGPIHREAALATIALPITLDVTPGSDDSAEITVTATASKAGVKVVAATVRASFVEGKSLELPVTLCASCVGVTCATGDRCESGRCIAESLGALPSLGDVSRLTCAPVSGDGGDGGPAGEGGPDGDADSSDVADAFDAFKPDVAALGCGVAGNGLEGYWQMDEDGGTVVSDCSGKGVIGTLNGTFQRIAGRIGPGALHFDGSGYVDLGSTLALSGPISIAAWVKVDSFASNGRVLSKSGAVPNRGFELNLEAKGTANFQIALDGTNQLGAEDAAPSGVWTHIAGVFVPGTELRLFVDGKRAATVTTAATSSVYSQPAQIARRADDTGKLMGAVDDVRIYSRVLTDAEIADLAAQ